jgi:hypothetical protein
MFHVGQSEPQSQTAQYQAVTIQRAWLSRAGLTDANGNAVNWSYTFDCVVSEDVSLSSVVTHHPVNSGVSIADHMYDEPDRLTITAIVSDLLPWAALDAKANGGAYSDDYQTQGFSRSMQALAIIDGIRQAHEPFNVQTGLRLFENMVIEKIHYVTDQSTAAVLSFTAELVEVKIVDTQTVTYKMPTEKKIQRQVAPPPENKGNQDAPAVDPEATTTDHRSLLLKGKAAIFPGSP